MEDWKFLFAFTFPHEMSIVRSKLESEGIETLTKDEETLQAVTGFTYAIGGVKIFVQEKDLLKAQEILTQMGYIGSNKAD